MKEDIDTSIPRAEKSKREDQSNPDMVVTAPPIRMRRKNLDQRLSSCTTGR